ncbi:MAG: hypothetical protein K6T77_03445, partial [candidate division WOR-3 bacterium]|nr:hypothetical protein [candidate division WOR-3 bacterium]
VSEAASLEKIFPVDVARRLRERIEEAISQRREELELNIGQFRFDVKMISGPGLQGFLVRYGSTAKR